MGMGLDILNGRNITRIREKLIDKTKEPVQPLLFLGKTNTVDATDDEITLVTGSQQIWAADVIAADAPALIRSTGTDFSYERSNIVKMKHGYALSESQIQLLSRIEQNAATPSEIKGFARVIANASRNLEIGLDQRRETMIIGMLLGGYNYNRLGIKIKSNWQFPAGFNVRVSVPWDDPVNSRPISNLRTIVLNARDKYGRIFTTATMSYQALQDIIESNEFKDRIIAGQAAINNYRLTRDEIFTDDITGFAAQVARMVGLKRIETYDAVYREPSNFASNVHGTTRFLPEEKVILTTDGANDWDFANGVVMEAIMAKLGGTSIIGSVSGGDHGPVTYATQANPNLNPSGYAVWSALRGAPRKLNETASAVLTVY